MSGEMNRLHVTPEGHIRHSISTYAQLFCTALVQGQIWLRPPASQTRVLSCLLGSWALYGLFPGQA